MSKKLTAYSNVYNPVHRKSDTENPLARICNPRAYYTKIIKKALTIARKGSVPRRRLELPRLATYAPQAYLYTIPTPGHVILSGNNRNKHLS